LVPGIEYPEVSIAASNAASVILVTSGMPLAVVACKSALLSVERRLVCGFALDMGGSFWIENEEFVTAAIRLSMGAVVPWIFAERQLSGRMMVQPLDGATSIQEIRRAAASVRKPPYGAW